MSRLRTTYVPGAVLLFGLLSAASAQEPAGWAGALPWRSIGPANMGGRITALAMDRTDSSRWWAATASGGLLYTTNNGVSFAHQFDREGTVSIGDVAVSASHPDIVWVGSGEANPRNSVSWGDGVYRSTDGGKSWTNMGLRESFQIGAVCIHPTDPDTVYVGALGRLWGDNEERGLYKTVDGGTTWERILFVDDRTGVVDVQMHPTDPETLLVATWERQRDGFDENAPVKKWGPGSALWKTSDGGGSFTKITAGLPTCQIGRIGLDYCTSAPDEVVMVLESERIGRTPPNAPYLGITGRNADPEGAELYRVVEDGPSAKAGIEQGDIVLAIDGEPLANYPDFIGAVRRHEAGDEVQILVLRGEGELTIGLELGRWPEGGGRSPYAASLGGQRQNMQERQGADGHENGGIYRSADGGNTWRRVNTLNPRPMYFSEVRFDPQDAEIIYCLGIRLWRSTDGGKSFSVDGVNSDRVHPDHHALWIDPQDSDHLILGNDGGIYVSYDAAARWDHLNHVAIGQFYHAGVDTQSRAYRVYGGLQDNGSWGGPSRVPGRTGPENQDWFRVGEGDGFRCLVDPEDPDQVYFTSQRGGTGRRDLGSGERARISAKNEKGAPRNRFNWSTPFLLSNHNSRIYYVAGNRVFRSISRGAALRAISPEISHTDRGTATTLAESAKDSHLLYVGTDDGALWVTRDGGLTWEDLFVVPTLDETTASEEAADPPASDAAPERGDRNARLIERLLSRDTDGDGRLTAGELGGRAEEILERADKDADGALTRAELRAAFMPEGSPAGDADGETKPAKGGPAGVPLVELVPERRWVSCVEVSRFRRERAYLVLDGHRSNDDRPHLFVTEDTGRTWRSLTDGLPEGAGPTRVLREDIVDQNVLYLGTELGAWVSLDRGRTWSTLNTNLPTVAVHDFALHPTAGEIVAATHGRSLWVLDVTALRQMRGKAMTASSHLFQPASATLWRPQQEHGRTRTFVGQNPPAGAVITYRLAEAEDEKDVTLTVQGLDGKPVRTLAAKGAAGLHRVVWDLRRAGRRGNGGRARAGRRVAPGTYRVVLKVRDVESTRDLVVAIDPAHLDERWLQFAGDEEEYLDDRAFRRWQEKFAPFEGDE